MTYDPSVVSFAELCDVFYAGHNPRQKTDKVVTSAQYRSSITYTRRAGGSRRRRRLG